MRLSNLADYGVVVMTAVASVTTGTLASATSVSRVTGIPTPTVAKLLGQLGRAGLLNSHRGANGGFSLAHDAADISLADIIEAIDGPIALTHCGQSGADCCELADTCVVRPHWAPVNQAVRAALSRVTLAELTPDLQEVPA